MALWRRFFILFFFLEVEKSSALQSRLHSKLQVRLVGMHEDLISKRSSVHRGEVTYSETLLETSSEVSQTQS